MINTCKIILIIFIQFFFGFCSVYIWWMLVTICLFDFLFFVFVHPNLSHNWLFSCLKSITCWSNWFRLRIVSFRLCSWWINNGSTWINNLSFSKDILIQDQLQEHYDVFIENGFADVTAAGLLTAKWLLERVFVIMFLNLN